MPVSHSAATLVTMAARLARMPSMQDPCTIYAECVCVCVCVL